ncbi:MAG: TolC family protein [Muribaculaceae bacterium]|nr:TolC family protein [Muribaculaceae bacterium]
MKFQSLGATLLSFAIAVPAYVSAQETANVDTLALSLDQCIAIALDDNPAIKIADMEIERVDYSKKEIIGQLLPSISFDATYSRTVEKQVAYMNMSAFKGLGGSSSSGSESSDESTTTSKSSGNNGIKMGLDNSYAMGFTAAMPIIAPQLWKTLSLSDTQILQNVEAARKSRIDLINQVKAAYYGLLLAEDSYKVILESFENAKFNHDVYLKKYQVGTASEYDVLRSSVTMKNIEPELSQAEIAIKQARLQLMILMGMEASVPVKTTTKLSDYEETMYDNTLSLSRSIADNSDLRMLDLQTKSLKDALSIQKMAWFPTLALTANYNWTSSTNGTPFKHINWNPYSVVGLTLSIPIFQGGQRYTRIKQASIQVQEMKWQRENLERTLKMQVDVAIDNIQMNVKQIASTSESVKQADKAHQIMTKSFEIGAASYLDLRDSELALTRARLAYYQSIYNYLIANSNLELLLGNADIEKYSNLNK